MIYLLLKYGIICKGPSNSLIKLNLTKLHSATKGRALSRGEFYDRRNILRSYIGTYKRKDEFEHFALIIDNLFEGNTRTCNLPLLEEIIAECSEKIYIFLDTMSASLELGLFSSAYKENSITVYLPNDYQFFKPSIGDFVKNSIDESKSIKLIQYSNRR